MSDGGSAQFNIDVDPSAIAALGDSIARSLDQLVSKASKSVGKLDETVARQAPAMGAAASKLGAATAKGLASGIKTNSASVQAALIQSMTQTQRGAQQAAAQTARQTLAAQTAAARLANTQAAAAGKANAAIVQGQAQQAVIAARTSGAQRVAITRFTLDSIGRLEKGLGRIIEGTASTVVAATRRIFAGTVGSLQRSFAERRSTITRELRIEQGLFANAAAVQQRTSRGVLGFGLGAAGLIGGGALVASGIRQIFTLGSQFSRGLNVLQAQLQLTDEQMAAVSKQSIQLGNDINLPGVSALDAANAIGLLAKQFANLGPAALGAAQDAAKGTLQLARATGAAPEEAAAAVGAAVNVFGENAANATKVADQLTAALSQAAGTSFSDFSQAFTQGASVVSSFITPADGATNAITEFSAAIAVLARGGLVGSDAGTSIKQFFLQANRGSKETVAALAEVSQRAGVAGTAFFDENGKARSLVTTVDILQRGLQGLTEEQRANTLQTIFGTDAARVANILLGQGAAELLKAEAAVQRQGAASALAAAQNKGLAGAIDAIKSQFETFGILIFQKVNKPLGQAGLKIADFIDKLANAGGVFAAVRAGIKGVAIALGGLVAIKGIVEVAGFLKSIGLALGPLGLTAIVVGGAVGFLLKRFGSFRGVLDAVGRLIDRVAPQVANLRETIFDFLSGLARRAQFLGRFSGFLQQIFTLLGQGKASQAFDRLKAAAGALAENLAPVGRAFANLRKPIEAFIQGDFVRAFNGLKVVAGQIGTAIRDVVSTAIKTVDPFAGIGIEFVKKFKAQFIGGGLGAIAGGLLLGPIGIPLGAALGVAVTNALGKLRDILGRVDVGQLFGKFLDGVQFVGRKVGEILSDKRTLLGVAGIAGAAAAIAVQFIQGFVKGVLSNLGDIRAAGAEIIKALFNLPSIAKSIGAFVILVRGLLTDQFKQVKFGDVLSGQINQGVQKATQSINNATLGQKLSAAFTTIGKKAGQALSVGIASALSGSALGNASNNLEKGLGIAGIAGSAAAAFTSFGGGPQGAIAAAATAGVGLLTAALGANAKKAAEAKAAMQEYKQALDDATASGKSTAEAIASIFSANVKEASDAALRGIKDVGLTIDDVQKGLTSGDVSGAIDAIKNKLNDVNEARRNALTDVQRTPLIAEAKDLRAALSFVEKQADATGAAVRRQDLEASIKGGADAANTFEARVKGVSGAFKDTKNAATEASIEARKLFAEQRAERLKAQLDEVKQHAADIGAKADEANRKLIALLAPKQTTAPTTTQGATDQATINTPAFASQVADGFNAGVDSALGGAQIRQGLNEFGNSVVAPLFATALKDGISKGDPAAALNQALLAETITINQLDIPQGAKDALLGQLNAQFQQAQNPLTIPIGAEANLLEAQKAAADLHAAAVAGAQAEGEIVLTSGADLVQAQQTGHAIQSGAVEGARAPVVVGSKANEPQAANAGSTIHSTAQKNADKQITVGNKVTAVSGAGEAAGRSIAANVGRGFQGGFSGIFASVQKTVSTILNGAVINTANAVFQIRSPSKVFMGIGEQVMKGLEEGIRSGGDAVQSAVEAVAKEMIDATRNAANSVPSALKNLLDNFFDSSAIGGGANTSKAVEGITTALRSVVSQVSSNAEALFSAAQKDPNQRTLAERLLLGESFTSLRAGDEFGVANRGAITGAVEAIKAVGEALIEQGFSAQAAADQMFAYRQQLLLMSVQAGLAQGEVETLINSLGLSAAGLQSFVSQADRLNQIIAEGQRRAAVPNTPPPLTTGPNATQQFITNNLYLPTGDPEANALAVVNRQALAVR